MLNITDIPKAGEQKHEMILEYYKKIYMISGRIQAD